MGQLRKVGTYRICANHPLHMRADANNGRRGLNLGPSLDLCPYVFCNQATKALSLSLRCSTKREVP